MMRWDIINHLIKKNNYKSYLEIGYYKGWSFDRVECERKIAVDPNPCKTEKQTQYLGGYHVVRSFAGDIIGKEPVRYRQEDGGFIVKSTSDEFFETLKDFPAIKWDIIFIDGLHESQQVDKDIQNALKHLNPGGTIVMHDCNPPTELHITGTPNGEWTGDVYKSFCKYRTRHINETYVVDTDYGVGVIKDKAAPYNQGFISIDLPPFDYETFDKGRKLYLNLISMEEFLEKEKINE